MARKKRKPIGTIDCETDPFEPGVFVQPFLWGIYLESGEYLEFENIDELVTFIRNFEGILYAHNGGKFDYHFLRDYIESDEPISVIAGRVARCKIGLCELRDSLNLFGQTRLADFSKKEIDYKLMRKGVRDQPEVRAQIREYLRYDCESLFRLVSTFIDRFGLQFTQAGAAMKYWKKNYAPGGFVPRSTPQFYADYHQFYFGGRVQCFAHGHAFKRFKVVDINSAYPFAMLAKHPYSASSIVVSQLPKTEEAISQCFVELDAVAKGCFPLRSDDGSLFFPDDEREVRRYKVTGWELLAALETNTVQICKIVAVHLFDESVSFREYVQKFFAMRKEAKAAGDKAQDIFAKIFLNALYGKWASDPARYEEFILSSPDTDQFRYWWDAGYRGTEPWGGRIMLSRPLPQEKANSRYYNIATGASITGYVRAHLWRSIQKVSGPLYCDTDAIAAENVDMIDQGDELGQWKVEADCDEYAIGGKKTYCFHIEGKPRDSFDGSNFSPLDVRRQKPLDIDCTAKQWEEMRKCWKLASKGTDLSPRELIAIAGGDEVLYKANVPNFSVHRNDFTFIDRTVRSTYRDISQFA